MANDDGWSKYAEKVLAELKRHDGWLASMDEKLDNHITHIEHRLTKIESYQKSQKWILGILFSMVIGIFGMMFVQLVM